MTTDTWFYTVDNLKNEEKNQLTFYSKTMKTSKIEQFKLDQILQCRYISFYSFKIYHSLFILYLISRGTYNYKK